MVKRVIGLTGGIATGKSTVASYLEDKYQLPVLDADIYAREAVGLNSPILSAIGQRYGERVLLSDGSLNRRALADIIFVQPEEKQWLESKIHPYVRHCFVSQLQRLEGETVVLVVPLLIEAKMTDLVTEIWVVVCSEEEQIQRLQQRNQLTTEEARSRINSQLPLKHKIAVANIVLDNSYSIDNLHKQIDTCMESKY